MLALVATLLLTSNASACGTWQMVDQRTGHTVRHYVGSVYDLSAGEVWLYGLRGDSPWDLRLPAYRDRWPAYVLEGDVLVADDVAVGVWDENVLTLGDARYAVEAAPLPDPAAAERGLHTLTVTTESGEVILTGRPQALCTEVSDVEPYAELDFQEELRRRVGFYLALTQANGGSLAPMPEVEPRRQLVASYGRYAPECSDCAPVSRARIREVSATSTLPNNDVTKLTDGDLTTAWCEGSGGLGEDTTVRFDFDEPVTRPLIRIVPGFHKNQRTLDINAQPRRLRIRTDTGVSIDLVVPVYEHRWLHTSAAPLDLGVEQASSVSITLMEAAPGTTYEDTCLSEVQVFTR